MRRECRERFPSPPTPRLQRKPLVSDPAMHHGTCVTHVPWCMSGSPAPGGGWNVPGIPGACAPAIFRIWQEAHCRYSIINPEWCGARIYRLSYAYVLYIVLLSLCYENLSYDCNIYYPVHSMPCINSYTVILPHTFAWYLVTVLMDIVLREI